MNRYALVLALAMTTTTACAPNLSLKQADTLSREAAELLRASEIGDIEPERWPASVAALSPQRVEHKPEGLYIRTRHFFVDERGVFVRDPKASFEPTADGDPCYTQIAHNVYLYHSAG